jgi:hypothetical protein
MKVYGKCDKCGMEFHLAFIGQTCGGGCDGHIWRTEEKEPDVYALSKRIKKLEEEVEELKNANGK